MHLDVFAVKVSFPHWNNVFTTGVVRIRELFTLEGLHDGVHIWMFYSRSKFSPLEYRVHDRRSHPKGVHFE